MRANFNMNREIKFRVWDNRCKNWLNPDETNDGAGLTFDGQVAFCDQSQFGYINPKHKDKFVIQQFTGLKDRNGKEIYEGDFLRGEEYELPVKVIFSGAAFRLKYSNRELEFYESSEKIGMEIVGNIFENPELLK